MQEQKLIQIGITAARDLVTGAFLPTVPIYRVATPEIEQAETAAFEDIGRLFAQKMKQYIDNGGIIEAKPTKGELTEENVP